MAVIEITVLIIVFVIIFVWYTTETKRKMEPLLYKGCNEQLYETKKKLKDVNLRIRKLREITSSQGTRN
jgi:sensor domain CHASE-containing protein